MQLHLPARLNLTTFDGLYARLHRLPPSESLHMHMAGLEFAEPAGLLPLACVLRNHVLAGGTVVVDSFPASANVCGYLERMNFYKLTKCPCPHGHSRRTDSDSFIEITEVGALLLSGATNEKLYSLIEGRLDVKDAVGKSFLVACGELVQNTRHAYNIAIEPQAESWPPPLILAQYYEHSSTVHFTVADCGIGILRSLGAKDPRDVDNGEKEAIDRALVLGMRGDTSGKGVGLAVIRRFMHQNGGRFAIRSGTCLSLRTPHRRDWTVAPWKGAVVSLEIRGARNIDISGIIKKMVVR
jgi:hypothetical protein